MLLLQLALVVGFSFSFYTYVDKEVESTPVLAYDSNLYVGDQASVTIKEIPFKAIQENMLTVADVKKEMGIKDSDSVKAQDIINFVEEKFVDAKVSSGQFVYEDQLVTKEQIDPFETLDLSKYRKVSLPISYVEGFGGNVKRGDRVDLVFTGQGVKKEGMTEETFQYSKTFLQDVLVYSVTTDDGYKFQDHSEYGENEISGGDGEKMSTEGASGELSVITLAVTLDQIEEIKTRQAKGTISFASRFDEHQSYETLGYVIGDYDKVFSGSVNAETGRATVN